MLKLRSRFTEPKGGHESTRRPDSSSPEAKLSPGPTTGCEPAAMRRVAISIAADGVPFSPEVEAWLKAAGPFVTRLPESKKIFTKANGEFYKPGETFRQ